MVIESRVSQKACDKAVLKGHIWSLDHQCHGKHLRMFSSIAIYGCCIVSVAEACDKVFLNGITITAI